MAHFPEWVEEHRKARQTLAAHLRRLAGEIESPTGGRLMNVTLSGPKRDPDNRNVVEYSIHVREFAPLFSFTPSLPASPRPRGALMSPLDGEPAPRWKDGVARPDDQKPGGDSMSKSEFATLTLTTEQWEEVAEYLPDDDSELVRKINAATLGADDPTEELSIELSANQAGSVRAVIEENELEIEVG